MKYVLTLLMILPLNAFGLAIVKINKGEKMVEFTAHRVSASVYGLQIYFKNEADEETPCYFNVEELKVLGPAFEIVKELTSSDKKYEVICWNTEGTYYGTSIAAGM
jgi:hypothetical protein